MDLREFGQSILRPLASNTADTQRMDRLAVKFGGVTRFVRAAEVDWIASAGVYVTLHVDKKQIPYRASLSELMQKLDPQRFIRVHRSAIINVDSIVQLEPLSHGEFEAHLKNGSRARVSRTYRALLERRRGQAL